MNHNRKRREAERKRRDAEERDRKRREGEAKNAAPVNRDALRWEGGWFPPDFVERGYYLDVPFTCVSCGAEQVWTATQQKWWYEVARGSVHSGAARCRACRREMREHKGKADPLHDLGNWLRAIRDELGPALAADGWVAIDGADEPRPSSLSYQREDSIVRFRWHGEIEGYFLVVEREGPSDHGARGLSRLMFRTRPQKFSPPALRRRLDAFLADARSELGLAAPAQSRDGATT